MLLQFVRRKEDIQTPKHKKIMHSFTKTALKSVYFNTAFGMAYFATIYVLSQKAYDIKMSYYLDITQAIYYKIYKCLDCNWSGYDFIYDNQYIFLLIHSIISDVILMLIISFSFKFLIIKKNYLENNIKLWNKAMFITVSVAFFISLLIFLMLHIFLKLNKEINWMSEEYIFEMYYPAFLMFEHKWLYLIIGFITGLIYVMKQKKKHIVNI